MNISLQIITIIEHQQQMIRTRYFSSVQNVTIGEVMYIAGRMICFPLYLSIHAASHIQQQG